jgi:molybdopterin molybdotransferase
VGAPAEAHRPLQARAAVALEPNGARQHYMRATTTTAADGLPLATPVRSQDSSLLAPLAEADCLLVRPPHAPPAPPGTLVPILPLDF